MLPKIIYLIIFICIIACVVVITVCNILVNSYSSGRLYDNVKDMPEREYGLLLGTSPEARFGGPNAFFVNRIQATAELYNAGKVKKIIVSGDVYDKEGYGHVDEPLEMAKALIAKGIPETAIIHDAKGYRTLESVKNISAKGINTFTVISQKFHNQRCIYQTEHFGLPLHDIIGYNAEDSHSNFAIVVSLRELLARVKLFLDIAMG